MDIQKVASDTSNALVVPNNVTALIFGSGPVNKQERDELVSLYHLSGGLNRQVLLGMFERKAHEVKGAKMKWEDFCAELLDLSDTSYAYDLLRWARVERAVLNSQTSAVAEIRKLPRAVALTLAKLPEAEQPDAWKEVSALHKHGTRTPGEITRQLKKIVASRLSVSEAEAATAAQSNIPPIEPPRPKANMTPVVPPTYDRGPDHDDDPIPEPAATSAEQELPGLADDGPGDAATSTASPDIDAPHKYPATEQSSSPSPVPAAASETSEDTGAAETLLVGAVRIIRRFRNAVKTASTDDLYEADAAALRFLKEVEASGL